MPIQECKVDGRRGWKFGASGKCYVGTGAKARARRQERAIRATGWTENARQNSDVRRRLNPLRIDPTRTATLRRRLMTEFIKRLERLKGAINKLLIEKDAFGLKPRPYKITPLVIHQRFMFHSTPEKVKGFQTWLKTRVEADMFVAAEQSIEQAYWYSYVEDGYKKGAGRAFDDTNRARRAMASTEEDWSFYSGGKEEFLRSSFARPIAIDKVKLLAGRVFGELENVTKTMATQMSRTLTDGLVQGKSPREIARDLNKSVDKIGKVRARMIARTEIIRAHAEGQLDALEQLGVEKVGVMVEWSTTGDALVCDLCGEMQGVVLTLSEARGMIPRHPNCRCAYIPANVGEKAAGQKRGKEQVQAAVDDSIRAELPKIKKRTLAEQKTRTSWPGADKRIAKRRPRSMLEPKEPRVKKVLPKVKPKLPPKLPIGKVISWGKQGSGKGGFEGYAGGKQDAVLLDALTDKSKQLLSKLRVQYKGDLKLDGAVGITKHGDSGPLVRWNRGNHRVALHELGHATTYPYKTPGGVSQFSPIIDDVMDLHKTIIREAREYHFHVDLVTHGEAWSDVFTAYNSPGSHLILREGMPSTFRGAAELLGKSRFDIPVSPKFRNYLRDTAKRGWLEGKKHLDKYGLTEDQGGRILELLNPAFRRPLGKRATMLRADIVGYKSRIKEIENILSGAKPIPKPPTVKPKPKVLPKAKPKLSYRSFSGAKEMDAWGKKSFGALKYSEAERAAITNYVGPGYADINTYLRKGKLPGVPTLDTRVKKYAASIDSAMKHSKLAEPVTVHRGLRLGVKSAKGQKFLDLKVGESITDKGFLSTSIDKSYAEKFKNYMGQKGILLEVRVPKGTSSIYTDVIFPGMERELLLNRGMSLRLVEKKASNHLVFEVIP